MQTHLSMLHYVSVKTLSVHCTIDQLADMMISVQHTIFKAHSRVHIKGASVQYLIQL